MCFHQLIRADIFEQVIQSRYLGTKRFSLEGLNGVDPFSGQIFATAAADGVNTALIAMAHRGRLNVMTNTIGRKAQELFAKFEDVDPRSTLGGGDVKYHMGATGSYTAANGATISLHLASNPSHLEAVNPGGHGPCACEADTHRRRRQEECAADHPAWRRCVRRPGALRLNR